MMRRVTLPRSGLGLSRLAFGTSRLHHVGGRECQSLLSLAADRGITHFDTAPAYGDGLAERELGRFARGRRDRLTIASKYGIPPDPVLAALPWFGLPWRALRSIGRRLGAGASLPPLTAEGARASVEASLGRLGTDRLDILLLHEPHPDRIARPDELTSALEALVVQGKVRQLGLAGGWTGIVATARLMPGLGAVIQAPETEWTEERVPDLTFGALARGPQSYFAGGVESRVAADRMRAALARRPNGAVIVSTTRAANLELLAQAAADT